MPFFMIESNFLNSLLLISKPLLEFIKLASDIFCAVFASYLNLIKGQGLRSEERRVGKEC